MFRAVFLSILCGLTLAPVSPGAGIEDAPTVGAIRWDGWYGDETVTKAVEYTLGQPKYHFRLPWFAEILGGDKVRINGDSQAVIEKEISYAAKAGLHYWAFLDYWTDAPRMQSALMRYIEAPQKKALRYCLIEEGGRLDEWGAKAWEHLIEHFHSPHYQTVLGGRPLLYVYIRPSKIGKREWDELKRQCAAAGLKVPYLVLMGWDVEQDAKDMVKLGFDALSSYARGGAYSMEPQSYDEQCAQLRKGLWEKWRALNTPCVTLASSGWDTRPRNERPPSWIKLEATPDATPFSEQKPLVDAVTATPEQLGAHLQSALDWTKANRDINLANTVLIYAWNEHDEGGWLQPTLGLHGEPNDARIRALEKVLRSPAH